MQRSLRRIAIDAVEVLNFEGIGLVLRSALVLSDRFLLRRGAAGGCGGSGDARCPYDADEITTANLGHAAPEGWILFGNIS
jgi:hypothetical protein